MEQILKMALEMHITDLSYFLDKAKTDTLEEMYTLFSYILSKTFTIDFCCRKIAEDEPKNKEYYEQLSRKISVEAHRKFISIIFRANKTNREKFLEAIKRQNMINDMLRELESRE